MSDPHAAHETDLENAFTDQEWQALKKEDLRGATAVVGLMLAIFLIGVVLYSIVVITL